MSRGDAAIGGPTDPDGDRERLKRGIRTIAVQAALLSAGAHVLWATPRLAAIDDPRPYLFVLAALFTLAIAVGVFRGDEYRRLYALGAGTLGSFPVGFVLWHRGNALGAVTGDPLALVGKVAEVVGVVAFVALYVLAPPTSVVLERKRASGDADSAARDGRDG